MKFIMFSPKENTPSNKDWKEKNKGYLRQLQRFLDTADNIKDEDLKGRVINEMLKCDMILTQLAQKQIMLASKLHEENAIKNTKNE